MKQISIGDRTFLTKSVCKHVQERLGLDDAVRAQAGPEGQTCKFYCKNDVVAISDGDVLTDVVSGKPIGTGWRELPSARVVEQNLLGAKLIEKDQADAHDHVNPHGDEYEEECLVCNPPDFRGSDWYREQFQAMGPAECKAVLEQLLRGESRSDLEECLPRGVLRRLEFCAKKVVEPKKSRWQRLRDGMGGRR